MGHYAFRRNGTKTSLTLTAEERQALEALLSPLELTAEVRRAQALLWLDAGHSPQTVAKRLHVSRQAVYHWIAQFQAQRNERERSYPYRPVKTDNGRETLLQ